MDRLIAARERELATLAREAVPFYVRFLRRVPGHARFGYCGASLLVSLVVLFYMWVLSTLDVRLRNPWSALLLPLMVGVNLRLATEGYLVTLRTARSVLETTSDETDTGRIGAAFRSIFVSSSQLVICIGLGIVGLLSIIVLRLAGSLPSPFQDLRLFPFTLGILPITLFAVLGGAGVWLVISLIRLLRVVGGMKHANLNLLMPHATVGLRALSLLSKRFALCFSLGLALFMWPILLLEWQPGAAVAALVYSWPLLAVFLVLVLLVVSRLVKVRLISRAKEECLRRLQGEMREVLDHAPLSPEQTSHLQELLGLYKDVDQARDPLFRLGSMAAWLSALGIQLPFLLEWLARTGIDPRQWYELVLKALRMQ
jgi:hypothetical protein